MGRVGSRLGTDGDGDRGWAVLAPQDCLNFKPNNNRKQKMKRNVIHNGLSLLGMKDTTAISVACSLLRLPASPSQDAKRVVQGLLARRLLWLHRARMLVA